jgi:hypothetical protein
MFSNWRSSLFFLKALKFWEIKVWKMLNLFVLRKSSFVKFYNVGRHNFPSGFELGGRGRTRFLLSINHWDVQKPYKKKRFLAILALTKSRGF